MPEIGDRVRFEGSTWQVANRTLAALQRVGGHIVTVAAAYVVLVSETSPITGAAVDEMKVVESRWDEITVNES